MGVITANVRDPKNPTAEEIATVNAQIESASANHLAAFLKQHAEARNIAGDSQSRKVVGQLHEQVPGYPCLVFFCPTLNCAKSVNATRIPTAISGPGKFLCHACGKWCEVVRES